MKKEDALVHLARLSLAGRRQDIQMYIARMAQADELAEIKKDLFKIIDERPTPKSPLRSASFHSVPIDEESRLQLARFRPTSGLETQPIWSDPVAEEIEQIIKERQQRKALTAAGLAPIKTVLFTGPPGVGKTMSAYWCAQKLNLPLLVLDLSTVMSSYLGRTGVNLKNILDYAKNTESVMLLDEIDAIAKDRGDSNEIGELKRLVNILLQEIDDWPDNNILIGATNYPDLLDKAVWRRFEKVIDFELPGTVQVKESIKLFLGNDYGDLDPQTLAALAFTMGGKSYSDIEDHCMYIRKYALLRKQKLNMVIKMKLKEQVSDGDKNQRKQIAVHLCNLGYSQRESSQLTGPESGHNQQDPSP